VLVRVSCIQNTQIRGETIAKVFGKVDTFWTYQSSMAPKASKARVKKPAATHGSKRLKKSIDTGVSLEIHQSMSSSDNVCVDPGIFAFVPCVIFILTCLFLNRS
jgi:hypothetical protein